MKTKHEIIEETYFMCKAAFNDGEIVSTTNYKFFINEINETMFISNDGRMYRNIEGNDDIAFPAICEIMSEVFNTPVNMLEVADSDERATMKIIENLKEGEAYHSYDISSILENENTLSILFVKDDKLYLSDGYDFQAGSVPLHVDGETLRKIEKMTSDFVWMVDADNTNDYDTYKETELFRDYDEAKAEYDKYRDEMNVIAMDYGYVVEESDNIYECYEDGYYAQNHHRVSLEKKFIF